MYNVLEHEPIEARVLNSDVIILRKQTQESNGGISGRGGECVGEKLPLEEALGF